MTKRKARIDPAAHNDAGDDEFVEVEVIEEVSLLDGLLILRPGDGKQKLRRDLLPLLEGKLKTNDEE